MSDAIAASLVEELRGAIVVLTRQPPDNDAIAARVRAVAAKVIEYPCVRVEATAGTTALSETLAALGPRDWVVVTSRHGADVVARLPTRARFAAVGPSTARRLRAAGVAVAFEPSTASGACLARELPVGGRAALVRSDRALPDLPAILRQRGFAVEEVAAYRTVAAAPDDGADVRAALASGHRLVVLFFSPSAVEGFVAALGATALATARVLASGDATLRAVLAHAPATRAAIFDREVRHVAHR